MRKAQIQAAVAEHMAALGYLDNEYSWRTATLRVLFGGDHRISAHHMSRRRLAEILERIPQRMAAAA